ncbi:hypothetical protein OMP38_11435 [Cohnella ginsengisoli]|uniref:Uncharacterized protein n=1 Tax=Cohnella ginsengisoli TaxID=425004 RepID=A0A9X4KH38_9BACL|nr:hypothetical protein [Cohnella ginsengisoli]MDG0791409.1 hypothetical protein [Cohnella ginsengisoli]
MPTIEGDDRNVDIPTSCGKHKKTAKGDRRSLPDGVGVWRKSDTESDGLADRLTDALADGLPIVARAVFSPQCLQMQDLPSA